jgi:Flp pilus assembly protein TadB
VASQKSKRRSRKRQRSANPPRAVPAQRREVKAEQKAEQRVVAERQRRQGQRQLGTVGERPPGLFGGVPVSEIAIFAGLVAMVVWLIRGGTAVLVVGLVVITLGVLEVTGREHFSGYRSHTTLLAAIPAVALGIGVLSLIGDKRDRGPLLAVVAVPVYALLFWLLRKRFMAARQARLARPPAP